MKTGSYRCLLADDCGALAVVQIADPAGAHTRGCFPHALDALKAIGGARVIWSKTRVNEWAERALRMTEERIGATTG